MSPRRGLAAEARLHFINKFYKTPTNDTTLNCPPVRILLHFTYIDLKADAARIPTGGQWGGVGVICSSSKTTLD